LLPSSLVQDECRSILSQTSQCAVVGEPIASTGLINNQEHNDDYAHAFIVASNSRSRTGNLIGDSWSDDERWKRSHTNIRGTNPGDYPPSSRQVVFRFPEPYQYVRLKSTTLVTALPLYFA
jgi:hypothetical protein